MSVSSADTELAWHGDQAIDPAVHNRRWLILFTLCLSVLIIVMDNTILGVAIPPLVKDLGATNSQVQWIVDGYVLVFAGLLLTAGSLGDRFGRRRTLWIGIVLFSFFSIASALSTSAAQLIVARSLMGVGAALIMPSTLSLLSNVFRDPKERGRAISVWAACSGLGVAIGPVAGGTLLAHFSWHSVFWINLPIGAAALIAGAILLPESKDDNAPRLDPLGALLSILGLGGLVFGIIEGPSKGWSNGITLTGFAIGLVSVVGFIAWELHTDHPMLDLNFFRNPRFTAASASITLSFFATMGSMFLMTQYWQFVMGYTPLQVGVRLMPYAVTLMIAAPLSARVTERLGTKRVVTLGLVVLASSMLMMSTLTVDSGYTPLAIYMTVMAVGMAFTMAPATESVMGALPRSRAGVGSAVNDTTRQMGGAIGIAVIGSLVASLYASDISGAGRRFGLTGAALANSKDSLSGALQEAQRLGGTAAAGFARAARLAFVDGFTTGLRVSTVVIGLTAVLAYRCLPARGHDHPVDEIDGGPAEDMADSVADGRLEEFTDPLLPVAGS